MNTRRRIGIRNNGGRSIGDDRGCLFAILETTMRSTGLRLAVGRGSENINEHGFVLQNMASNFTRNWACGDSLQLK